MTLPFFSKQSPNLLFLPNPLTLRGPWFLASEASESLVLNMTFEDFFEMFNFSLAPNSTILEMTIPSPTVQ